MSVCECVCVCVCVCIHIFTTAGRLNMLLDCVFVGVCVVEAPSWHFHYS